MNTTSFVEAELLPRRFSNLSVGRRVRVRSEAEILRTLDGEGKLEGLPFMPEMLRYCGEEFVVSSSAHKTCDTEQKTGGRRMPGAVHLGDLRCDGLAHGGCQASCLLFWKEAWLEPVSVPERTTRRDSRTHRPPEPNPGRGCTREDLAAAAADGEDDDPDTSYRCQATELFDATSRLVWWDPRHYIEDVRSGNVRLNDVLSVAVLRTIYHLHHALTRPRRRPWVRRVSAQTKRLGPALVWTYNRIESLRGGPPFPYGKGTLERKTPKASLDLQPGDLVEVKSFEEILETLDQGNRNRGLRFDSEMVRYCGQSFRVAQRVSRIINEETGQMMKLPNDCITLTGVVCRSECSARRLFCPRRITPYWREIWLRRVAPAGGGESQW